jgi:hypothetical protein
MARSRAHAPDLVGATTDPPGLADGGGGWLAGGAGSRLQRQGSWAGPWRSPSGDLLFSWDVRQCVEQS